MSVRKIKAGSTNVSVNIRIIDSTDGTPETGVVWNTAGIDLWYRRELAASTDITEATLAALTTAHTDGGFLHINDGWYRLDLPDAAVADGVTGVQIGGTVTGMVVLAPYVELVDYDPYDGVRLGLTALPDAAADAAGGVPISDAGGLDLDTQLANTNEVTAARMGALTDWINGGRLDLILDTVAADVVNIDGDAMRGTDSAALASVCTEGRLAELDAANLPADVDAILVDTADMQPRVVAIEIDTGTTLDGKIDTIDGNVDTILVDTADMQPRVVAIEIDTSTTLDGKIDTIDGNVDTILVDTADMQPRVVAIEVDTGTTLDGKIDTIDTNVDAILVDTSTTIPGTITTLQADTDDIQTRLPAALVGGRMDSDVEAVNNSTGAADQLAQNLDNCFAGTASGTPTTTTMISNVGITVDDQFNGRIITFNDDTTTANLRGQSTDITACTAASNTLTFTALTTAPISSDTFVIT